MTVRYTGAITAPSDLARLIVENVLSMILEAWAKQAIPQMRSITPVQRGRLLASLYVDRQGKGIVIGLRPSGFYWRFVNGLPDRYRDIAIGVTNDVLARGFQTAVNRALADLADRKSGG